MFTENNNGRRVHQGLDVDPSMRFTSTLNGFKNREWFDFIRIYWFSQCGVCLTRFRSIQSNSVEKNFALTILKYIFMSIETDDW